MRIFQLFGLFAASVFMTHTAIAAPVKFQGNGLILSGELFKPKGKGPFPAVVALHGCSGLYRHVGGLQSRDLDWSNRLVTAGFMVLLPDSFGSRKLGAQCKVEERVARPSAERRDDAIAAKRFLETRSDVRGQAISLIGWSNGASATLFVVSDNTGETGKTPFATAVAFYPGCRSPLERGEWHSRTSLLILMGDSDDWTPVAPCKALVDAAVKNKEPASIVVYPGAVHEFDHPGLSVHKTQGLAFTGDGSGTAKSGTNLEARADALQRVLAFLAR